MKTLFQGNFRNQTVLVRCDFNVAIGPDGKIAEDFRIVKTLPTIRFLMRSGALVVLMSHLEKDGKPVSLEIAARRLEKLLMRRVNFLDDCVGPKVQNAIKASRPGQLVLLENLRFHPEEKAGDKDFARQIAQMGDSYVNEAFSVSHRAHASIVGVPLYLPSCAGLLFQEEVANLSKILENPSHPFVVIVGGNKIKTKSKMIANIVKTADHVLVGSKIGENILAQKQQIFNRPEQEHDPAIDAIDITSPRIHLPVDGVLALKNFTEGYLRTAAVGQIRGEEDIYDLGPETSKFFAEIIRGAKTLFFNGPVGCFEKPEFAAGTKAVLEAISRAHGAYRVAGGGETLEAIHKFKAEKNFEFLSTGGGAMLEFLGGDELPGIAALNSRDAEMVPDANVPRPTQK